MRIEKENTHRKRFYLWCSAGEYKFSRATKTNPQWCGVRQDVGDETEKVMCPTKTTTTTSTDQTNKQEDSTFNNNNKVTKLHKSETVMKAHFLWYTPSLLHNKWLNTLFTSMQCVIVGRTKMVSGGERVRAKHSTMETNFVIVVLGSRIWCE